MSAPEPLKPTSVPDAVNGWTSLRDAARVGIWRHRPALGLPAGIPEISLGEGDTPIVPLQRWGSAHGLPRVLAKLEYVSPTGSFKDRGAAAVIAVLAGAGVDAIVEDSSGNAGAAMAAYAARAGLRAQIFVPESAPAAKRDQIAGYGAQVVAVAGTREDVATAAEHAAHAPGVAYASHARHPAFVEGTKTFGLEIAAALADDPPLHIVLPVGNGGLLARVRSRPMANWRHRVSQAPLPRLHAAQTSACRALGRGICRGRRRAPPLFRLNPRWPAVWPWDGQPAASRCWRPLGPRGAALFRSTIVRLAARAPNYPVLRAWTWSTPQPSALPPRRNFARRVSSDPMTEC